MNELTLRDWFAGCALQGMIAQLANVVPSLPDTKNAAMKCYQMADEMLRTRDSAKHPEFEIEPPKALEPPSSTR
ncbi:MAG: hypothetical protein CMJ64_13080 [Planctomycetaceae bacterium]|nr:hypothetical protein [Planctomycetaceae bacterium]